MQSTMRHLFLDDLSCNDGAKGAIAGRDIAVTVETSTDDIGDKTEHYARNCKGKKESNNRKSSGAHDKQENKESSKVKTGSKDSADVLCTRLPPTMTRKVTRREHHARPE